VLLRSLNVSFNRLSRLSAAGLAPLSDLRELRAYGNAIRVAPGLVHCRNTLERLMLQDNELGLGGGVGGVFLDLRSLQSLRLDGNGLRSLAALGTTQLQAAMADQQQAAGAASTEGLQVWCDAARMPVLRELDLSRNALGPSLFDTAPTPATAAAAAGTPAASTPRWPPAYVQTAAFASACASGQQQGSGGGNGSGLLAACPVLRKRSLQSLRLGGNRLRGLLHADLSGCPALEELYLDTNPLGSAAAAAASADQCEPTYSLSSVTAEGLVRTTYGPMSGLQTVAPTLRVLTLDGCGLTDADMRCLLCANAYTPAEGAATKVGTGGKATTKTPLPRPAAVAATAALPAVRFPRLAELALGHNSISERSLGLVAASCPALEVLDLAGNPLLLPPSAATPTAAGATSGDAAGQAAAAFQAATAALCTLLQPLRACVELTELVLRDTPAFERVQALSAATRTQELIAAGIPCPGPCDPSDPAEAEALADRLVDALRAVGLAQLEAINGVWPKAAAGGGKASERAGRGAELFAEDEDMCDGSTANAQRTAGIEAEYAALGIPEFDGEDDSADESGGEAKAKKAASTPAKATKKPGISAAANKASPVSPARSPGVVPILMRPPSAVASGRPPSARPQSARGGAGAVSGAVHRPPSALARPLTARSSARQTDGSADPTTAGSDQHALSDGLKSMHSVDTIEAEADRTREIFKNMRRHTRVQGAGEAVAAQAPGIMAAGGGSSLATPPPISTVATQLPAAIPSTNAAGLLVAPPATNLESTATFAGIAASKGNKYKKAALGMANPFGVPSAGSSAGVGDSFSSMFASFSSFTSSSSLTSSSMLIASSSLSTEPANTSAPAIDGESTPVASSSSHGPRGLRQALSFSRGKSEQDPKPAGITDPSSLETFLSNALDNADEQDMAKDEGSQLQTPSEDDIQSLLSLIS
jgi:Leucine-rich repeat (LRR) protein